MQGSQSPPGTWLCSQQEKLGVEQVRGNCMFGLRKPKSTEVPADSSSGAGTLVENSSEFAADRVTSPGVQNDALDRSSPNSLQPVMIGASAAMTNDSGLPWSAIVEPDREREFQLRKMRLHESLVEALNLKFAAGADEGASRRMFRDAVISLINRTLPGEPMSYLERMARELIDEAEGLGPLECLIRDDSITDVLVNNPQEVYVERRGVLERTPVVFADASHLLKVAQRLTARVGRRVDESNPMVDARLADGSRLNVTIPPLAIDGATISIRRFPKHPFTLSQLVERGSLTAEMAAFLEAATVSRLSFLISGGTGTGKTTLLNALAGAVPHDERIITVEDSAELRLCHPHVVRMESRMPNTEGLGSVGLRELVRNALRMRPDRLLVGEVRGAEAIDMLQAMNTGHEGSFSTIHANDARESLTRLEMMIAMGGFELPLSVIRAYIVAGIRLIIQLARWKGGARRIVRISEVVGLRNGEIHVEDVFRYQPAVSGEAGGGFQTTGHIPACIERIRGFGFDFPDEDFRPPV